MADDSAARQVETARPGWWKRLHTGIKLGFGALTALVVTTGALFAIVGNPFAPDPRESEANKSPAAVAAYQIQRCMRKHKLGAARVAVGAPRSGPPSRQSFRRCDWPPLTSTSGDGYSSVDDRITWYRDRDAADPFNSLHTLRGVCDELVVSVVLYQMSSRTFRDAKLRPGPVFLATSALVNGEPAVVVRRLNQVPIGVELPPPGDGSFLLLLNGHMEVLQASCVPRQAG